MINKRNFLLRSVSGLIYIGIILGCIFWGFIPLTCLAAILGSLATIEFEKICEGISPKSVAPLLLDMAGICCLSFWWLHFTLYVWICIYIARVVMELYLQNSDPIKCLTLSLSSQLYIGLPFLCMTAIALNGGLHLVLAIFLMIWINDTGAFLVGCTIGKNRLFERISPKKSWEGFFGGLAFNLIAGWLFAIGGTHFWGTGWSVGTWLLFGTTVTIFSTWGDLLESLIKRSLNIKDSGNIIPGHGGILDRIDSLLLVMPASLVFLYIADNWIGI